MSQENVTVVREAFEAFQEGDREKTARLVDPEAELHGTVGGLGEGRVYHGLAQIIDEFENEDLEAWEVRRLEPEEFIDAGDLVVVLLHEYRAARQRQRSRAGDRYGGCLGGSRRTGRSHAGLHGPGCGSRSRRVVGVAAFGEAVARA